ncbi:hypothetical protein VAPA_1c32230 [Variovorax paradoxus B4]|uniref:Uncharacterized protein n=2 Tax=Variovorax paradoxus TaxID=34073 RepID=A0A0H2M8Z4_VARPD|nr:hypothetical protein [Variovorax paradoxus]AGU50310.1 hypothetical protein VAPA_1c32230 [Variovorax paradoxus B4]KLN58823.1 hypothetical protein VPARA_01870 [Variovorax paradoxus]
MQPPIPFDCRLQLASDTHVEIYWFQPNGFVRAVLGTQDGPQCAPLFRYRVLSGDSIELIGSDGIIDTWTNIRVESELLHAESKGEPKAFRITQEEAAERGPQQ